ncbi:chorismate mutase ARO7 [Ascoidea rubescens DSM 1968]|uniref:Chorismate mutase n=1 Tax=Ascoidea rubescens DSM 1968 TaxID=1344418 RepID=A0A1D2VQE9_9ASCO|nr:chorismate mutase [Ascoidea rubescens DSM 1968]ODV63833.1 chorismate mutase [Ascoidea rubescens DSM 1968]
MDFLKPSTVLDLANIRDALVRMEDTIVFNLIERSQFYSSPSVYEPNKFKIPNFKGSFLDYTLLKTEITHSELRRYEAPDELSFFKKELPKPLLPPINYPKILTSYSKEINVNNEIKEYYVNKIVPVISARKGEQLENLGSCTLCDIDCLQSISRRIHFGRFVAEAKFQQETERFKKLILDKDITGLNEAITNQAVEDKILVRLIEKGKAYGTDPTLKYSQNIQSKVRPKLLAQIYKDWIIPLTKQVEIDYLLRRLEEPDTFETESAEEGDDSAA